MAHEQNMAWHGIGWASPCERFRHMCRTGTMRDCTTATDQNIYPWRMSTCRHCQVSPGRSHSSIQHPCGSAVLHSWESRETTEDSWMFRALASFHTSMPSSWVQLRGNKCSGSVLWSFWKRFRSPFPAVQAGQEQAVSLMPCTSCMPSSGGGWKCCRRTTWPLRLVPQHVSSMPAQHASGSRPWLAGGMAPGAGRMHPTQLAVWPSVLQDAAVAWTAILQFVTAGDWSLFIMNGCFKDCSLFNPSIQAACPPGTQAWALMRWHKAEWAAPVLSTRLQVGRSWWALSPRGLGRHDCVMDNSCLCELPPGVPQEYLGWRRSLVAVSVQDCLCCSSN